MTVKSTISLWVLLSHSIKSRKPCGVERPKQGPTGPREASGKAAAAAGLLLAWGVGGRCWFHVKDQWASMVHLSPLQLMLTFT